MTVILITTALLACVALALAALLYVILHQNIKQLKTVCIKLAQSEEEVATLKKTKSTVEIKLKDLEANIAKFKKTSKRQDEKILNLQKALHADPFDGRFPICSNCKDIRDEGGAWHQVEEYVSSLSETDFSHSLCPECAKKLYPDMFKDGKKLHTLTWK